jgi:hypothetical protein
MTSLSFQPVGGYWAVAATAVVLFALLSVRPLIRRTTRGQRLVLAVLRGIVIGLVLLSMLRPEIVYTDMERQSATLAILIDGSRSLEVADAVGGQSRWEILKRQLERSGPALEALDEDVELKVYLFDRELHTLDTKDGKIELPTMPDGSQTAIGAALAEVVRNEAAGRLLGVVLASDGAQRAFAPFDLPPQQAARQYAALGIPVYAIPLGKAGSAGDSPDLAVENLIASETVFAEAPTEVTAEVNVRGYAGLTVRVQLLWESAAGEMQVADTQLVRVGLDRFGRQKKTVTLRHTPAEPGEQKVTVVAVAQDGEQVTRNNEVSTFVTVKKGGVRVLLLHGAQREGAVASGTERRAIKWALDASPDIMVEDRLITYENDPVNLADRFEPGELDVLLLLNVDFNGLTRESWQAVAEWVERGGGLGMLGGYHSFGPGGFATSPLDGLMPVAMNRTERQPFGDDEPPRKDVHLVGEIRMKPSQQGMNHWIMDLGTEQSTDAEWAELPPLLGANLFDRRQLKAGASLLAEADDPVGHPLLVTSIYSGGRVLAFAGDSTGRWRRHGHGDALRRFWRQAVLWLAKKDQSEEGEVWLRLDERRVPPGAAVSFAVGANTPEGEPVTDASFEVVVTTPDQPAVGARREVPVAVTRRGAMYLATFPDTQEAGDYAIRVTARAGAQTLGSAEGRFLVVDQDIELDNPIADVDLMASLAETTAEAGGQALAPEELPALFARLAERTTELDVPIVRRVSLYDNWPFLLLFVAVIGVEWFLRKKWGLV